MSLSSLSTHDASSPDPVTLRCRVTNARSQSAKLAFLALRDRFDSLQAVVAASETLSRQMVRFAASVPAESLVDIVGLVREPASPVKSASVADRELHVTQLWVVSRAAPKLPVQFEDVEKAVPGDGAEEERGEGGRPVVGLATRLDNRVLDLRSTLNTAIFEIRDGVSVYGVRG